MIGNLINAATVSSKEDGTEATYAFDVQEFGLAVDQVVFAVEITGRSSENVRVRVHQDHGASLNDAGFITTAPDPISLTTVTGNPPLTLVGTSVIPTPYFQTTLGVSSLAGAQESVTVNLYVGGRRR